ncbi:MAG: VWA domain-containing protein, partial [Alphaproteobacteria bacterium]|nr:VWA domain-containing protein [Alphaproteobacteria bacterium]
EAARAHAALAGRAEAIEADLSATARLVLAPRATRLPPPPQEEQEQEQEQEPPPPEPPQDDSGDPPDSGENEESEDERQKQQDELEEMLVEAAEAAIPQDLLEQLAKGNAPRRTGAASGTGQKKKAGMRGKPLGARPGMPRGGNRLALIDTLRAAVPWQQVRRREREAEGRAGDAPILMRKEDLRIRRYEEKTPRVTIFAVDASGSAAAARLAEAKGAVELMLGQAYVTRSEVALIAFRGDNAELLLPPTRSLTRAKRALSGLPGGGGTPLALGLTAARECAESVIAKGRTASLVILTDGRGNIDADGQPGRAKAREDAEAAAKAIGARGIETLVVDISPRPAREGAALAEAMRGRFLALPRADAKTLQGAIQAAQTGAPRAAA